MTHWLQRTAVVPLLILLGVGLACGPPTAQQSIIAVADSMGLNVEDPACDEVQPDGSRQCRRIVEDGTISLTEKSTGLYRLQRFWSYPTEDPWHRLRDSLEAAFAAVNAVPFSCGVMDTQPLPRYVVSRAGWYRSPYVALMMAIQVPGAHGGYRVTLDLLEPEEIECFELPD
jgi:hypothetical protein